MIIKQFLHASLLVADLERAMDFYHGVLGLEPNKNRPDLGYPGVWFDIGSQQIHLLQLPNPDPVENRPQHGGRDRHTALQVDSLEALVQCLEEALIPYTRSKSGRKALFCRDPDGNALEFVEG